MWCRAVICQHNIQTLTIHDITLVDYIAWLVDYSHEHVTTLNSTAKCNAIVFTCVCLNIEKAFKDCKS